MTFDIKQFCFHIELINSALNSGNLVLFTGAGFSKLVGYKSPTWAELTTELCSKLSDKTEMFDSPKIAELYRLEFGEISLYNEIKKYFPENYLNVANDILDQFLSLKVNNIVTTNWDNVLENEINSNGFLYETISCDEDLLQSNVPYKYIKMHGDFKAHNIVISENDYLNYENNFPIIFNYIKNLLSTNIVIFVGYSFNDPDIKQIINWINTNTIKRKNYYFVTFDEFFNEVESKYFEKYGFKVLNLNVLNNYIDNSNKKNIVSKHEIFKYFLKIIKTGFIETEYFNPFNYVYKKLKIYETLPFVTFKQIELSLTNCEISFIENDENEECAVLVFFDSIISFDNDSEKRKIYKVFLDKIKNNKKFKNEEFEKLYRIFAKANIKGIQLNDMFSEKSDIYWFSSEFNRKNCVSKFSAVSLNSKNGFGNEKDYSLYMLEKFREAAVSNNLNIYNCKKTKDYANLLIACFNRKFIKIHDGFLNNNSEDKNPDIKNVLEEYNQLSESERKELFPIFQTLSVNELYFVLSNLQKQNTKIDDILYAQNFIQFVFYNNILFDKYKDFEEVVFLYLKAMLSWKTNEHTEKEFFEKDNEENLSFCIRFLKSDKLKELLSLFFLEGYKLNKNNYNFLKQELDINFKILQNNSLIFSTFDNYIENIYSLFSNNMNNNEQQTEIIKTFDKVFANEKMQRNLIDAISYFVTTQQTVGGKINYESLNSIIERLITLFNINQYDGFIVQKSKRIFNALVYQAKDVQCFNNEKLLKEMTKIISSLDKDSELIVINDFVFPLFVICSDSCKKFLKDEFFKNLDFTNAKTVYGINFYLISYHLQITEKLNVDAIILIIKNLTNQNDLLKVKEFFMKIKNDNAKNNDLTVAEEADINKVLDAIEKK